MGPCTYCLEEHRE